MSGTEKASISSYGMDTINNGLLSADEIYQRYGATVGIDFKSFEIYTSLCEQRPDYVNKFAYPIISKEAMDVILKFKPEFELGAGTGYIARLMWDAGHNIIATEPKRKRNDYGQKVGAWYPVQKGNHASIFDYSSPRAIFMSWPCYKDHWSYAAATLLKTGAHLVMIGEGESGCTGSDALYSFLEAQELVEEIGLPNFPGIHDRLTVHRIVA